MLEDTEPLLLSVKMTEAASDDNELLRTRNYLRPSSVDDRGIAVLHWLDYLTSDDYDLLNGARESFFFIVVFILFFG